MFTQFELPNYFPPHWTQRHDPQTLVQQLQTNNVNVSWVNEKRTQLKEQLFRNIFLSLIHFFHRPYLRMYGKYRISVLDNKMHDEYQLIHSRLILLETINIIGNAHTYIARVKLMLKLFYRVEIEGIFKISWRQQLAVPNLGQMQQFPVNTDLILLFFDFILPSDKIAIPFLNNGNASVLRRI